MGQYSSEHNAERRNTRRSESLGEVSFIDTLEELRERREVEEHYVKPTIDWDELSDSVVLHVDRDELIKLVGEVEDIVGREGGIMSKPFLQSIIYRDKTP